MALLSLTFQITILLVLHILFLPNISRIAQKFFGVHAVAPNTPYLKYLQRGYTPYARQNKLPEEDNARAVTEPLPQPVFFNGKAYSQFVIEGDGCIHFHKDINLRDVAPFGEKLNQNTNQFVNAICPLWTDSNIEEFKTYTEQPSYINLLKKLNETMSESDIEIELEGDPGPKRSMKDYDWPNIPPENDRGVYHGLLEEFNAKALFTRIKEHIWACGMDEEHFLIPQYIYMITWLNMPAYGHNWRFYHKRPLTGFNTFQMVLVLGYSETYVLISYDEINWLLEDTWDLTKRYSGPIDGKEDNDDWTMADHGIYYSKPGQNAPSNVFGTTISGDRSRAEFQDILLNWSLCKFAYHGQDLPGRFLYRTDWDVASDFCHSDPCQNGGRCNKWPGGYACACEGIYIGLVFFLFFPVLFFCS